MSTKTEACYCGQLSIDVHDETAGVGMCHCLACQKRTGSVFAVLAAYDALYTVRGTATECVRTGDHGNACRFRFCPYVEARYSIRKRAMTNR